MEVLFPDEVTELTAVAQAKVLRALQEREFVRLVEVRGILANIRVICRVGVTGSSLIRYGNNQSFRGSQTIHHSVELHAMTNRYEICWQVLSKFRSKRLNGFDFLTYYFKGLRQSAR